MTSTKRAGQARPKDLQGIRQRGSAYQVRVYGGADPVTGRPVMLSGTAMSEKEAIRLRNRFRGEVAEDKSARTTATVAYLIREWLAQHRADEDTVKD